ncbi:F0F1 ATP synthase subunit delta, partial [Streptomyces sp. NPDC059586]
MNGASREALAAGRERLDALTDNTSVDAAALADDLASVTALLHREVSLRRGGRAPPPHAGGESAPGGAPGPRRRHGGDRARGLRGGGEPRGL